MGRSAPLVLVAVVLLLILPARSSKAGAAGAKIIGRSPLPTKLLTSLLRKLVSSTTKQSRSGSKGQRTDGKLVESSADTVGPFLLNLTVGTSSPQIITVILDITTPLVWSQCSPCTVCLQPPAPTFEPNRSPTFSRVPCTSQTCQRGLSQTCPAANTTADDSCGYIGVYGEDTNTTGYLATDTFTLGTTPVPGVVFGCSNETVGDFLGASGVFGFSRGRLSLVSQLNLSWFSYLWASDESRGNSFFQLGDDNVTRTGNSRSTPLLTSSFLPELYFVNLTGIRVDDGQDLAIPAGTFDLPANGSGGVFLSTTTPVTYLEAAAYSVVREVIASKIQLQPVNGSALGLDLCYSPALATVPMLALVFDGDAVMQLKRYNYFFADNSTGLDCLAILPSPAGVAPFSVLGSLLQRGTNMTYDIADEQLIFETATEQASGGAAPARSLASLMMVHLPLAVWVLLF